MKKDHLKLELHTCFIAFANAILSITLAKLLTNNVIFATVLALFTTTLLAVLTKQINPKHLMRIVKLNS